MGTTESIPIPAPPPDLNYMVLMLTPTTSKIRVIFGTENELTLIRQAITQCWVLGLRMEKPKLGYSWTFSLNGWPFGIGTNAVQSASAKRMMSQILLSLNNTGWSLIITSDLSRTNDLTTFFFVRSQIPKQIQFPLVCVVMSSTDKLQLINVPNGVVQVIKNVVLKVWARGIQSECPNENSYEIKMSGNPWISDGNEGIQARTLIAKIMSALAQHQWILHAAANLKNTADSIFFKYDPDAIPGEASEHFVISLNRMDRLRIINAPQSLIPVVQQTIMSVWQVMGGVQKEQSFHGSWEFKLKGSPWWSTNNESVMARFLMCKIFEALSNQGWGLQASIDISRKSQDKSIFVFSQSQPKSLPVMCLSFNDSDKMRLINASQDLIGICREILMTKWYQGIKQEDNMGTSCTAHQFKLNGYPWISGTYSQQALHIRSMLCYLIQAFQCHGWKYLVSADVSAKYHNPENGPSYPVDVHSWWFSFEPDFPPSQYTAPSYGFTPEFPAFSPPSYDEVVK